MMINLSGYTIVPGAIESAHRIVIQRRMKTMRTKIVTTRSSKHALFKGGFYEWPLG
ncbi:MAG: hypothetical protein V3V00_08950 [Saprospiraceae bacterium]